MLVMMLATEIPYQCVCVCVIKGQQVQRVSESTGLVGEPHIISIAAVRCLTFQRTQPFLIIFNDSDINHVAVVYSSEPPKGRVDSRISLLLF